MALSISKELLSAVLKTEIDNCKINGIWCIYNYIDDEENDKWGYSSINIYELAIKTKQKYPDLNLNLAATDISEFWRQANELVRGANNE